MPDTKKPGHVYVWEGTTKKGFLEALYHFVRGVGQALKVEDKTLYEIQMAVGEAAANSQEHSYRGRRGKLRLEIEKGKGEIKIKLTDWGDSELNEEEVPQPHIVPELKDVDLEGLGMMMMRRVMDEIRFHSTSKGGHAVTMRKKISR